MPIDAGSRIAPVSESHNVHRERDSTPLVMEDGRTTFVRPATHSTTAAAYPTPTLSLLPEDKQAWDEEPDAQRSFARMHPAAVIVLLTIAPFAVCVLIYLGFLCLARRRAAADKAQDLAPVGGKEKRGVLRTPTSPYLNNPRLAPLPAYPQMVYVPPAAQSGTRPIFGHIRSPSGNHVFGVTDRWVIAEEGAEERAQMDRSKESLLVHEV